MIDIHSHILPEVDDGPRSLDESIEMCRASARDGVKIMVATPHAHDGRHNTHDPGLLRRKVEELNHRLDGELKIVLGCELRFTHDVVNHLCHEKSAPTIADGPYALVEFPHTIVPPGSARAIFELISNRIRPIIAHPERNHLLIAEPVRFYEMVEAGALGQMDVGSITGQFGKKVERAARLMLKSGLVHFIASDCHNNRNRLPGLSLGVEAAAQIVGKDYARALAEDNPAAVIEGGDIPVMPTAAAPKKKRKWLLSGK